MKLSNRTLLKQMIDIVNTKYKVLNMLLKLMTREHTGVLYAPPKANCWRSFVKS